MKTSPHKKTASKKEKFKKLPHFHVEWSKGKFREYKGVIKKCTICPEMDKKDKKDS